MKKLFGMIVLVCFVLWSFMAFAESKSFFYRATGNAAIASTLNSTGQWGIRSVRLHLNAVGGAVENFVIQIDSGTSTRHDTVLLTQAMAAVSDLVWEPDDDGVMWFDAADYVDFTYANTNTLDWGLEIEWVSR